MSSPGLQGLRPWIIQRVSAVYIALFIVYLLISMLIQTNVSYQGWANWVAIPLNNVGIGLFLLAILWHAWIGVRDIVLDYLPNVIARLSALTVVACVIFGSGLWGFKALFIVANYSLH